MGAALPECTNADKHTINGTILVHRNRVRALKEPPYTQQEADAAGGVGTQTF